MKCESTEIMAKDALHRLKRRGLPYNYDLNIYRGCSHGCKYCYARKNHDYHGKSSFNEDIFVKVNIVETLEKALRSNNWNKEIINIGGVCDSYQNCESDYRLMPDILKLMIKYKNPVVISTKSDLILRDIELIDELASHTYVNIAFSISNSDPELSKKVEPGASLPEERFHALEDLGKTKAFTGLHMMPILPLLADGENNLRTIVEWADRSVVSYMLTGMLYMTGAIRKNYLNFIEKEYPKLIEEYKKLYKYGAANKEYKTKILTMLAELQKEYSVNNNYSKFLPANSTKQNTLFAV